MSTLINTTELEHPIMIRLASAANWKSDQRALGKPTLTFEELTALVLKNPSILASVKTPRVISINGPKREEVEFKAVVIYNIMYGDFMYNTPVSAKNAAFYGLLIASAFEGIATTVLFDFRDRMIIWSDDEDDFKSAQKQFEDDPTEMESFDMK